MTTWITVCTTCKRTAEGEEAEQVLCGPDLADQVEACAADQPSVVTRRHACLMGCSHGCNVAIQSEGKLAYTLGRFEADAAAAAAIVEFAALHAQSETGQVPFREWPQGVKGHFVTRHPPLPKE